MSIDNSPKVALESLGCKLNQAETELIARQVASVGYRIASSPADADIYILNTCTVTHIADRKVRQALRSAHRKNPEARLVVVGCYAQHAPGKIAGLDGVALVIGNRDKGRLVELLKGLQVSGQNSHPSVHGTYRSRTRSFIKIQEGCSGSCTYCIVPGVRGAESSVPAHEIITQIRERISEGYQEMVLTGTRVGSYEDEGMDLTGLLQKALAEVGTSVRLRLSSLQPQEISSELIGLWLDHRLCPHFHMALQSGSNSVLARMDRRYTIGEYSEALSLIRRLVPGAAITTDVIVGFPGETDSEFETSYDFCRRMEFARIHVFSYSAREGTIAAALPPVSDSLKKSRAKRMLALAADSSRKFRLSHIGRTLPVLFEEKENGVWSGLTGNYIRVYVKSELSLYNKLLDARLDGIDGDGVASELGPRLSPG